MICWSLRGVEGSCTGVKGVLVDGDDVRTTYPGGVCLRIELMSSAGPTYDRFRKSGNYQRYVLLTNLSNASPEATWNSNEPELTIAPPFLT
jgi:hypothetical protein